MVEDINRSNTQAIIVSSGIGRSLGTTFTDVEDTEDTPVGGGGGKVSEGGGTGAQDAEINRLRGERSQAVGERGQVSGQVAGAQQQQQQANADYEQEITLGFDAEQRATTIKGEADTLEGSIPGLKSELAELSSQLRSASRSQTLEYVEGKDGKKVLQEESSEVSEIKAKIAAKEQEIRDTEAEVQKLRNDELQEMLEAQEHFTLAQIKLVIAASQGQKIEGLEQIMGTLNGKITSITQRIEVLRGQKNNNEKPENSEKPQIPQG